MKSNSECESTLKFESMNSLKAKFRLVNRKEAIPIHNFTSLALEAFSKPKAEQLKGFIAARSCSSISNVKEFYQWNERQKMAK